MTDKELEIRRKILRDKGVDRYTNTGSPKEIKQSWELNCIDMINSILAYGGFGFEAEEVMRRQETSWHNYLEDYLKKLGRKRIVELIQGQINDIERIEHNVFTDDEGCTYNSIIWKNEEATQL